MEIFVKANKLESDDETRTIVGIASKEIIDRDNEIILGSAWKLDSYRKNPIVLVAHNYSDLPVGKCIWIKTDSQGSLRFKAKFANTDRGNEVYQLFSEGCLNAFSVGFKANPGGVIDNPSDPKYKGVSRLYRDVELLEISCVPVPSNSEALVEAVKSGKIVTKSLRDDLIKILNLEDDFIEIKDGITRDNWITIPVETSIKECEKKTEVTISGKEGIMGIVCDDDSVLMSLLFDPEKWDPDKAKTYKEENYNKSFNFSDGGIQSIEGKSYLDDSGDLVIKIEQSENYISAPNPGEEGKHDGHEISTIVLSKKEGISAHYCIEDRVITGYMFNKDSKFGWDLPKVEQWIEEHKKSFSLEETEVETVVKEVKDISVEKIRSAIETELNKDHTEGSTISENPWFWVHRLYPDNFPSGYCVVSEYNGTMEDIFWKVDYTYDESTGGVIISSREKVEQEWVPAKSVPCYVFKTPEFKKSVIPYKDMGITDPEMHWDGPEEIKEADVEGLKQICAWYDQENPDTKTSYKLPHHLASDKKAVWNGVKAAMGALMGARSPLDIPGSDRKGVYDHLVGHYKQFDKEAPEFKDPEELKSLFQEETKKMKPMEDESMEDFISRCMMDPDMMNQHSDESKRREACSMIWPKKAIGDFDLYEAIASLKAEIETLKKQLTESPINKTADKDGNPSLYDISCAIEMVLSKEGCRYVVDVYPTNFPNGHTVYVEYVDGSHKFYRSDYTYDIATNRVEILGSKTEVLQSWVESRYQKDFNTYEKAGKVLSGANRRLIQNCIDQMNKAMESLTGLMSATEPEPKNVDPFNEGIEIDNVETKQDSIEIDNEIEIDETMIREVIESAFTKSFDIKGTVKEALAQRLGKAVI